MSDGIIARWTKILGISTIVLAAATVISNVIIGAELFHSQNESEFLHEQQRAYFGMPETAQVIPSVDVEKKPNAGFFVRWKNIGATRTEWSTGWSSIQYFPNGVPNNFDTSRPNRKTPPPTKTVVGPNLDLLSGLIGITNQEYLDAAANKGDLIIWGALDYADIVHPKNVHDQFCAKLVPSGVTRNDALKMEYTMFQAAPFKPECNSTE